MSRRSPEPYIVICGAVIFGFALLVYPSYDDWCGLTSPNFDSRFASYFLPYGSFWRPFDALIGYIDAIDTRLYPAFNHIVVVAGHVLGALVLLSLTRRLGMSAAAQWVSGFFFLLSPCMLGTAFSCDAFNQAYSSTFGLLAVWSYLFTDGKKRFAAWAALVLLAAWSKENGIAWAVVPPVIAFAFGKADRKTLRRHLAFGIAIAVFYGALRLLLPHTGGYNPEYSAFLLSKKIKDIGIWLGYTWVAADYVSVFHAPSRNLLLFGATLAMSLPMLYMLFASPPKVWKSRPFWGICACIVITASPNLLINMSVMNAYSSFAMAALLVAYCTDSVAEKRPKAVRTAFILYVAACVITDAHHVYKAIETSNVGKEMARGIIKETGRPVGKVLCVIVDDDERKFSSFCVLPQDAFGANASAVVHETGYQWPKAANDTVIARKDSARAEQTALKALREGSYDCAWIIDKRLTKVVWRQEKRPSEHH